MNALAQSTSAMTVSANGEENFPFDSCVTKIATRKIGGLTRERMMLNRGKIISGVLSEYRATFASIYGKTDKVPSDVYDRIVKHVDEYLEKQLRGAVNVGNLQGIRRAFAHKANDLSFVEKVTITGENILALQEQHTGCVLAIGGVERRLRELAVKPTPDYDRERALNIQLVKLNNTLAFIKREMENQKNATK